MQKENGKRLSGGIPERKKVVTRKQRKRRLSPQQRILLAVAVVLALAVVAVAAYQSLFTKPELPDKTPGTQNPTTFEEPIDYGDGVRPKADGARKSEDYYTVLVLGRDTGGGGNTDTMLLASYDVTNQKATVMSIPRDTMVNVNWDVKKINSVYNMNGQGEKGIAAVYKEVSQLVGFEPDYRVVVEWDAVGKIVDAIGGVYFDVPYDMDYHDPYQDLVIEQAKGYRLLNGDDAMQVIRWRKNDKNSPYGLSNGVGDDGRMKIQQDFLKAVIKQMMTPKVVLKLGDIAKVFEESVETDLSFQNILWFAKSAFQGGLSLENVEFTTMPFKYASAFSRSYSREFGKAHYLAYVVPDASALLELVNGKLSPFVEEFSKSDLDIMYVNSDGSVGSTTGYVEDKPAASPPDLSPYEEQAPDEPAYEMDENGNLIDPETGEIVAPPLERDPGTVPENPEEQTPPAGTDTPEVPGGTEEPVDPVPETPEGTTDAPADPVPEAPGVDTPPEPDAPIEPDMPIDPSNMTE